jgi:hypothetical protein
LRNASTALVKSALPKAPLRINSIYSFNFGLVLSIVSGNNAIASSTVVVEKSIADNALMSLGASSPASLINAAKA